ncbi:hypothetical protein [Clostridium sp. SHJSY1]|uniref:hypothetical protein n=1 Tax=Clostridium sp. SHJSY1 TaxID=2942483 RepID=UPI00287B97E1|nr:hypothetical protein [Clostridium sp. SHJSY1]
MKFINRKGYIVFLTFLVVFELLTFFCVSKPKKSEDIAVNDTQEIKLSDAIAELKNKEISFVNAKKENETYLIDIEVEGSKSVFFKKISDLENYLIKDYDINFNKNIIKGKVTLKYSPKGEF